MSIFGNLMDRIRGKDARAAAAEEQPTGVAEASFDLSRTA